MEQRNRRVKPAEMNAIVWKEKAAIINDGYKNPTTEELFKMVGGRAEDAYAADKIYKRNDLARKVSITGRTVTHAHNCLTQIHLISRPYSEY